MGQPGTAVSPADLLFDAPKTLDALRYHITEIRHVRDFVGSDAVLQRLQERNVVLRISKEQWRRKRNIARLLWLLDQSGTSYQVNRQNVATLGNAQPAR